MQKKNFLSTKRMAKIAILAVIAFILMYFEFPLPIAPSFYKIDFSELPVLIGGFALGPMSAMMIELLKLLLKVMFKGSQTAYIGEFANLICGCALVCPAAFIYKRNKTKKQATWGLFVGSVCMVIVGYIANVYLIIPAYINICNFPEETIVSMGQAIVPAINSIETLALYCTTPFNMVKAALLSIISFFLYKRVSPLLKRED